MKKLTGVILAVLFSFLGLTMLFADTGDFNNDSRSDLVIKNTSSGQTVLWFMNADGTHSGYKTLFTDTKSTIAGIGDFNNDGISDLIKRNTATGQTNIWFMNADGSRKSYTVLFTDTNSTVVGTGDFNNDDISDLIKRNTATGQTNIWFMNADGSRKSYKVILSDKNWTVVPAAGSAVWSCLGNGLTNPVNSLVPYSGKLYAASYGVSEWNGTNWTDKSSGLHALFGSGDVYALASFNNALFAGGDFTVYTPENNWYNNAARFSNGSWTTCGSGMGNDASGMSGRVNSLVVYNGQLYAGGGFATAGGDPLYPQDAAYIARFDGTEWQPVGGGMNFTVTDMVIYNGELVVSGLFTRAAYLTATGEENPGSMSANYIARWNGTSWAPLGSGMNGKVTALAVHNGVLYAGGSFSTAGGVPAQSIAKWNGTSWSSVGNGITGGGQVYTLAAYHNELYAGGTFTVGGGNAGNYSMSWDGVQWKSVGSGTNGNVIVLFPYDSDLIVGGSFSTAGGISASNVVKYSVTD